MVHVVDSAVILVAALKPIESIGILTTLSQTLANYRTSYQLIITGGIILLLGQVNAKI